MVFADPATLHRGTQSPSVSPPRLGYDASRTPLSGSCGSSSSWKNSCDSAAEPAPDYNRSGRGGSNRPGSWVTSDPTSFSCTMPSSHVQQICPDEDMNFRDTTLPFTVPNLDHRASLSCANSPRPRSAFISLYDAGRSPLPFSLMDAGLSPRA